MLFTKQNSRTFRIKNENKPGVLAKALKIMGDHGLLVGDIRVVHYGSHIVIRDVDVFSDSEDAFEKAAESLKKIEGVTLLEVRDETLSAHLNGKIEMRTRVEVKNQSDLRRVYTPGVATVARLLVKNPELVDIYTWRKKAVLMATNGTRVLGLGNIGVIGSLPIMEGKAALLNQLVGLYGIPVLINTRDVDEFVKTVLLISEGFGAVHLEDIETPACFDIEERLIEKLDRPVMHDDQHGTAVATLAAAINVCGMVKVNINRISFGQVGLGAAGMAIGRILMNYTGRKVLGYDIKEEAMERFKRYGGETASSIEEIFRECDFVILSTAVPNLVKESLVRKGQIIFALSNPVPEIEPERAKKAGAIFAADGKMINNLLAYPGIFKGSMKVKARRITPEMLISAAETIARCAEDDYLLPDPLKKEVHRNVAFEVAKAAMRSGVARIELDEEIPLKESF